MIAIKYLWILVLLSGVGGFGAAYVAIPSDHSLEQKLQDARTEIIELRRQCLPTMERAPIKEGRGRAL